MPREHDPDLETLLASISGSFCIEPIEVPECPVFIAVALPLFPAVTGTQPRLPAGRGLTPGQAMISAAAEALELVASLAHNIDRDHPRFEDRDGISFICGKNLGAGADRWFPSQQVFLDFADVSGEPLISVADTTGNAAAGTLLSATTRGMLECIERDAVALWWYGRQKRRHLALALVDPLAPRLCWWLSARERRTMLIDVTTDIGIPAVVAASSMPDGTQIALGSAAAPVLEAAVISAITEMVQTEIAMAIGGTHHNVELARWIASASIGMPQFQDAEADPTARMVAADPLTALRDTGFSPFMVDLTRDTDLLACVKVIVPGLCALGRRFDPARILKFNAQNPWVAGVTCEADLESLEPY